LHNHHPKISFASFADLFAMIERGLSRTIKSVILLFGCPSAPGNGLLVRFQLLRMVIRILIFRGIPDRRGIE
jgi:hypothetical protein